MLNTVAQGVSKSAQTNELSGSLLKNRLLPDSVNGRNGHGTEHLEQDLTGKVLSATLPHSFSERFFFKVRTRLGVEIRGKAQKANTPPFLGTATVP
ncbi:hypothetical protein HY090_00680 [Candidatus Kaiserbacteria bacterium]|nr:hypothetical protein [Candidatus Kaiserbacteria bacterium]